MIQPREMEEVHPIKLHAGGVSTTTEVWNMLSASFDGDVDRVAALVDSNRQLLTCQYDYTSPLHFAVREGHVELVKLLLDCGADPDKSGTPWSTPLAWARKKNHDEVENLLQSPELQH